MVTAVPTRPITRAIGPGQHGPDGDGAGEKDRGLGDDDPPFWSRVGHVGPVLLVSRR